jgi:predicted ester cyclase
MLDQTETPKQDYHYQVDQQVSVNSFLDVPIDGETVRFQVTNRYGASPEKIVKTVRANIEAYTILRQAFPRMIVQAPPQQQPPEPQYQPIDDSGSNLPPVNSFTAEKLSVSFTDGKFRFKVMGGKFTQYGITAWDEVIEAAGLKFDAANPGNIPNIAGWRVDYSETVKDGQTRRKVTRLLPPK